MVGTGARVSDTNVIALDGDELFPAISVMFAALSETATVPLLIGLRLKV